MNNSLAEVHPELITEWSEKNLPLTPDDISVVLSFTDTNDERIEEAVGMFLRQIVLQRGIPFEMKLPAYEEPVAYGSLTKEQFNAEIEKGMEDIKAGRVYTAGVKKNLWGRVLRKGELQRRSDGRYVYTD